MQLYMQVFSYRRNTSDPADNDAKNGIYDKYTESNRVKLQNPQSRVIKTF